MKRLLCALTAVVLLTGCAGTREPAEVQFFAMDTLMKVTVYDKDADRGEEAARAVQKEINRLDKLWSRTNENSDLARINARAGDGTAVEVDSDTALLIQKAILAAEESGGSFNPVMAPVMDAWGFTKQEHSIPTQQQLEQLLALTRQVPVVEQKEGEGKAAVSLLQEGQSLDAGAIAKGRAADLARDVLEGYDVGGVLLDLGGNITVLGQKPDGSKFRVAVKDPQNTAEMLCVLTLAGGTCSTSGGYERYFEENGTRYHHIIDPYDGYPADSGLISVTVVSENGTWADAYSTACFVMGAEKALEFWRTGEGAAGEIDLILVTEEGHVYVTEGLEAGFDFRGGERGYTYEIVSR